MQPCSEELQDINAHDHTACFEFLLKIQHLFRQRNVLTFVLQKVGVPTLLQHPLFGAEMRPGVADQTVKDAAEHVFALPFAHRLMQSIQKRDQVFVLSVNLLHTDKPGFVPGYEGAVNVAIEALSAGFRISLGGMVRPA